jgi:hypothetical protein
MAFWKIISAVVFVTFLVYLFNRSKLNDSVLKWMWLYLILLFIGDFYVPQISSFLFRSLKYTDANNVFYSTLLVPLGMAYYNSLFYQKLKPSSAKYIPLIALAFYFIVLIVEASAKYCNGDFLFLRYSYITGCLSLLITIFYYLYKLMMSDRILDFYNERMFYIAIGIFIFYIVGLPKFVFLSELRNYSFYRFYEFFVALFNVLMYGLFSIAAIWGKRD